MGCFHSKPDDATEKPVDSIAIIGGGIAGLCCAYYLAKKGVKVCVYEKHKKVGSETSYGPAAVTMWKGVSKKFDLDGTVDLTSASVSDASRYVEGAAWSLFDKHPERDGLIKEARNAYVKFMKDNPDAASIMNTDGLLYLLDKKHFQKNKKNFKDDKSMVFYTKKEFEKQKDLYDPLFDGVDYYGVILSKDEGYVDPRRTVAFMAEQVKKMGGEVKTGIKVDRVAESTEGVEVIVEGSTQSKYSACIVALGAFPKSFVKKSGFKDDVPEIYGVKGYSVTGKMPEGTLRRGVVDGQDTKFIRPFVDKNGTYCVRFGGIADPYDAKDPYSINWDRMEEFKKNVMVNKLFENNSYPSEGTADTANDCIVEEGKVEVWTGVRPVNKHGRLPLIRYVKGSKTTMVVSGFGSNGFVMCWYAGPEAAKRFRSSSSSTAAKVF